jgi:hypothetical protein
LPRNLPLRQAAESVELEYVSRSRRQRTEDLVNGLEYFQLIKTPVGNAAPSDLRKLSILGVDAVCRLNGLTAEVIQRQIPDDLGAIAVRLGDIASARPFDKFQIRILRNFVCNLSRADDFLSDTAELRAVRNEDLPKRHSGRLPRHCIASV